VPSFRPDRVILELNRRALVLSNAKELIVRTAAGILVLLLGACNVDTDSATSR
jgi:hypothetical protein